MKSKINKTPFKQFYNPIVDTQVKQISNKTYIHTTPHSLYRLGTYTSMKSKIIKCLCHQNLPHISNYLLYQFTSHITRIILNVQSPNEPRDIEQGLISPLRSNTPPKGMSGSMYTQLALSTTRDCMSSVWRFSSFFLHLIDNLQ